jgi:hypothetical protein
MNWSRHLCRLVLLGALSLPLASSPRAQIGGVPELGDGFGKAVAVGDFNGDGVDDLAVGAPGEDGIGAFHVIYGAAGLGLVRSGNQYLIGGGGDGAETGTALAAGDFNNDGFDDLVLSSPRELVPGSTARGGVVAWAFGSPTGVVVRAISRENQDGAEYGLALATGDFNGDGFDDTAIGSPGYGATGSDDSGRVDIFLGQNAPALTFGLTLRQGVNGLPGASEAGDRFGAVLAVGNFDSDPWDELVVGIPGEDIGSVTDAGAVMVLTRSGATVLGSGSFIDQDSPGIPGTVEAGDGFGYSLATGRFNGSPSFDGLAIGAPFEDLGTTADGGWVVVINSTASGLDLSSAVSYTTEDYENTGAVAGANYGWSLAAGRFAGGSQDHLAVGAPGIDFLGSTSNAGAVYTLRGISGGLTASGTVAWFAGGRGLPGVSSSNDRFGSALAAGDFNGDGRDDVAIGEPGEDFGGAAINAGQLTVVDNASYPSTTAYQGILVFQGANLPASTAAEAETPGGTIRLSGAAPNPIGTRSVLTYELPVMQAVRLSVVDVLGREVAVLSEGNHAAGQHRVTLDASVLSAGTYVVRLASAEAILTQTVTILR